MQEMFKITVTVGGGKTVEPGTVEMACGVGMVGFFVLLVLRR